MAQQPQTDFRRLFTQQAQLPDGEIELDRAALYLAGEHCPSLEVGYYLQWLDRLAAEVHQRAGTNAPPKDLTEVLAGYLFRELGFRSNSQDYYNANNSFLNRVLESRTGIPITLSLLFMEVGKRLGLVCHGVGLPGHFLVGLNEPGLYLDPFSSGQLMSKVDCRLLLRDMFGERLPWREDYLQPYRKHHILFRMLSNLYQVFFRKAEYNDAIGVLHRMLLLDPSAYSMYQELSRCHLQQGSYRMAIRDLEMYLKQEKGPAEIADAKRQIQAIWSKLSQLN